MRSVADEMHPYFHKNTCSWDNLEEAFCSKCGNFPLEYPVYLCTECEIILCQVCESREYHSDHVLIKAKSASQVKNMCNNLRGPENKMQIEEQPKKKKKKKKKKLWVKNKNKKKKRHKKQTTIDITRKQTNHKKRKNKKKKNEQKRRTK
eukprot:TRINITY_DN47090_c0_g1_i1.p3 TRINITY_DN47090_c0_g1~~TRINITY_DN47090_c0_g1_i1.p3  ORF type:complete len:149 (+),score=30.44 TRINITY_DN47090_c0_g1_i1:231-677(+)